MKMVSFVMKDDVTKVSISKKDITGDNEIPGATLQIKDENGDVVENGHRQTSRMKSMAS